MLVFYILNKGNHLGLPLFYSLVLYYLTAFPHILYKTVAGIGLHDGFS